MMAESGGNPRAVYKESNGVISAGLYQLSVVDGKYYGCDFKNIEDVFDSKKNTECKDKISIKLRSKYPILSYQLALGKYWGPLRGPEWGDKMRPKGWNNFVKFAAKKGCVIN